MWKRAGICGLVATAVLAACGGSADNDSKSGGGSGGAAGSQATGGSSGSAGSPSGGGSAGVSTGGAGGVSQTFVGKCGDPVPTGAPQAADPPTYAGTCPNLVAGENTISSSGNDRQFILVLPAPMPANPPVLFLWHWLGGDAQGFIDKGDIQAAADAQGFIAVVPEKKGDNLLFVWPATLLDPQAREDEELQFFDDMLACVSQQFSVDKNCVGTAGVSAGALWTDQLAGYRSQYLSSFISLSGGTAGLGAKPWHPAEHKLPGIVLWGGDADTCAGLFSFKACSQDLEDHLTSDGHFFVECIHNCGHGVPPIDAPPGESPFQMLWQFVLDHPYWTSPGQSPYLQNGLPSDMPEWCGIGKDGATPRTDVCIDPSAC
jgi:predicted esterase